MAKRKNRKGLLPAMHAWMITKRVDQVLCIDPAQLAFRKRAFWRHAERDVRVGSGTVGLGGTWR